MSNFKELPVPTEQSEAFASTPMNIVGVTDLPDQRAYINQPVAHPDDFAGFVAKEGTQLLRELPSLPVKSVLAITKPKDSEHSEAELVDSEVAWGMIESDSKPKADAVGRRYFYKGDVVEVNNSRPFAQTVYTSESAVPSRAKYAEGRVVPDSERTR